MEIVEKAIKAIVDNYNYSFPYWMPGKLINAFNNIDINLSQDLDFNSSAGLLSSLKKKFNTDLSELIVQYNYPIFIETNDSINLKPINKTAVIVYSEIYDNNIEVIKKYAEKINADFILLNNRTQGYEQLERFRVKSFTSLYDRIIFFNSNIYVSLDCPNLFDIVPNNKIGIYDNSGILLNSGFKKHLHGARVTVMKCEYLTKFPGIDSHIQQAFDFESSQITTDYDGGVIVFSKEHASIWNPPTFPLPHNIKSDVCLWQEIIIYRDGHEVYPLEEEYNYHILSQDNIQSKINNVKIINYDKEIVSICSSNVNTNTLVDIVKNKEEINNYNALHIWINGKEVIPYANKKYTNESIDISKFKILCLGHEERQFETIEDREYLTKINLNELNTNFGNEYAEARIYDIDFNELFPEDKKYVGLVTASWNKKYIGLNPIDSLHEWYAIRKLDENIILCANTEPAFRFIKGYNSVMMDVLKMDFNKCKHFLDFVNLEIPKRLVPLSNIIIAKKEIVKSLFDFYKNNNILTKIDFFTKSIGLKANKRPDGRREAYLSELVTAFWIANQDFDILPQEIRRMDWY